MFETATDDTARRRAKARLRDEISTAIALADLHHMDLEDMIDVISDIRDDLDDRLLEECRS